MTGKPLTPTDIIAARIDSRRLAHAVVADLESHGFVIWKQQPVEASATWVKTASPYTGAEPSDAEKDGGGDSKPRPALPAMYGLMEDDGD